MSHPTANKTIYLAAAHAKEAYLPELVAELRSIERALRPLQEKALWNLAANRAANLDDIFEFFIAKDRNIAIFHYAGHAGQEELHLEGGGHTRGISELFGITQGSSLQLVFLNGCATAEHVDNFHQAGIAAVIATSCPIDDQMARHFAVQFYTQWAHEAQTLEKALQLAQAYALSKPEGAALEFAAESRLAGRHTRSGDKAMPWGLYLNPALSAAERQTLLQLPLNPKPVLPPQLLSRVRSYPNESVLTLVDTFLENDADARAELEASREKDPVLVLISRMPWTIGTHLRRLFSLEDSLAMLTPGQERLRELVGGYTELTRFLCYAALSALWDGKQSRQTLPAADLPTANAAGQTNYLFFLRHYYQALSAMPEDPSGLKTHIGHFLDTVDAGLQDGHRILEDLKKWVYDDPDDAQKMEDLLLARTGKKDGLAELCLQAETLFAQFLEAALFLTRYTLFTIRAISVDKIRSLVVEQPFVHKTITLHAAFSDIKPISTQRQIASDNYCLLLAPRKQEDLLANALNLTPFYFDKNAFLSDKVDHYPAIYVLEGFAGEQDFYVFRYIDRDINHRYAFTEDHRIEIRKFGAVFPSALGIDAKDCRRFNAVFQQLQQLKQDFRP